MLPQQLYDSYMHFGYVLYTVFCYVFAALIAVIGGKLAWFIAFGEGVLTIQIGSFLIVELELTPSHKKK
jgi:hypothetical protein